MEWLIVAVGLGPVLLIAPIAVALEVDYWLDTRGRR